VQQFLRISSNAKSVKLLKANFTNVG